VVVVHERGAIAPVAERAALQRALLTIAQRRAAGLLVVRLETLDRSVAAQEAILALIRWHGGRVLTAQADSPERADEARRQFRQMAGVLLRLERGLRSARARAALRRVREQGRHSGGAPAFGFQVIAGRLTEDTAEQAALDRIVELRRSGRSLRDIARTLEEEEHRPKRGDRWHPETVRRILARLVLEGPGGTGRPG
jgi:DNA invertase Pin-like site-specific DNA recombinase